MILWAVFPHKCKLFILFSTLLSFNSFCRSLVLANLSLCVSDHRHARTHTFLRMTSVGKLDMFSNTRNKVTPKNSWNFSNLRRHHKFESTWLQPYKHCRTASVQSVWVTYQRYTFSVQSFRTPFADTQAWSCRRPWYTSLSPYIYFASPHPLTASVVLPKYPNRGFNPHSP